MSALPTVVLGAPAPEQDFAPLEEIAALLHPADSTRPMTAREMIRRSKDLDVVGMIIPGEFQVDKDFLNAFPQLRVIANTAAGYNNLPLEEMTMRNIWATNTPDAFVDATADATMGLLLGVARYLPLADQFVRSGRWQKSAMRTDHWAGMELRGKTLGVVGFGRTGQAVATRSEAFGMEVIFTGNGPKLSPQQRSLDDLLSQADVVTLHVPLNDQTHHLVTAESFAKMKNGAILLNLSRGPVVKERDLVAALKQGKLGAAALDVFEDEPNVSKELFGMANVVLAPHLGGATRESRRRARHQAAQNVADVIKGERPENALNGLLIETV